MKKILIILIIIICLIVIFSFVSSPLSGNKMENIIITECRLSENQKNLSIKTMVYSSIGYVKTYKIKQDVDKLYITFYSTFGFNNPNGAKDNFDIDITDINFLYYYSEGEYNLLWQR